MGTASTLRAARTLSSRTSSSMALTGTPLACSQCCITHFRVARCAVMKMVGILATLSIYWPAIPDQTSQAFDIGDRHAVCIVGRTSGIFRRRKRLRGNPPLQHALQCVRIESSSSRMATNLVSLSCPWQQCTSASKSSALCFGIGGLYRLNRRARNSS